MNNNFHHRSKGRIGNPNMTSTTRLLLQLWLFPVVIFSSSLHKEPLLLDQDTVGASYVMPQQPVEPFFAEKEQNITGQIGGSVFLHCPLMSPTGDNRAMSYPRISWVRLRDWSILSNGVFTITSDQRFSVLHNEGSYDWVLQIKYIQERDAGIYECQVSTDTGKIARRINLNVSEPVAFILGGDEYHIKQGSQMSLTCVIENTPSPPQYVFWYHGEKMVNYDTERGISVSTSFSPEKTQSVLHIADAVLADSGLYTCMPAQTRPASITVFVSGERADKMEALHKQQGSNSLSQALSGANTSSLAKKTLTLTLMILLGAQIFRRGGY